MAVENCASLEKVRYILRETPYEIEQFIGEGGMACVYLVKERGSPNRYALKFIKEEYLRQNKLMRAFAGEAKHMRDLAHPNIVRFYKLVIEPDNRLETQPDYAYIRMDYVEGNPLSNFLRYARNNNQFLSLDEVMRITAQIARAISHMHREKFTHRDIKPGNILIQKNGHAYLTDLGIATSDESQTMMVGGTRAYMPCEQQLNRTISPATDIYSFAIVVFEMLTNQRPFLVDRQQISAEQVVAAYKRFHCEQPIPSLSVYRGDLPNAALDAILSRAMAKRSQDRYQEVLDFALALHEVLRSHLSEDMQDFATITSKPMAESLPVQDSVVTPEVQQQPRQILAGLLVFVVVALLGGVGILAWSFLEDGTDILLPTPEAVVVEATVIPIPSTDVPPTDMPPTDVPPTDAPPTDMPPTTISPTDVPPTEEIAAAVTEEPAPTDTKVVPTRVPLASATDTEVIPATDTKVVPTRVPPTEEPVLATATPRPTDTPTDIPMATATPTATPIPATVTPTATPPPVPTAFLVGENLRRVASSTEINLVGVEPSLEESLAVLLPETNGLAPIRVPASNGFRIEVTLDASRYDSLTAYGGLFRFADVDNYTRFVLDPSSRTWEVVQVAEGQPSLLANGQLDSSVQKLWTFSISGRDEFFRIEVGEGLIQEVLEIPLTGYVGLWLPPDADPAVVSGVEVYYLGADAEQQNIQLEDPIISISSTLAGDIQALLATGDRAANLDCAAFLPLHEGLERHFDRNEVSTAARTIRDESTVIYNTCLTTPDETITLATQISDYLRWRGELEDVLEELAAG